MKFWQILISWKVCLLIPTYNLHIFKANLWYFDRVIVPCNIYFASFILTLFRVDLFRATHGWRETWKATIMTLYTVLPYPKRTQNMYRTRDISFKLFWLHHFSLDISSFCYIKKYRQRLNFDAFCLVLLAFIECL